MNDMREVRFLRVCAVTAGMFAGALLVAAAGLFGFALATSQRPEGGVGFFIMTPLMWWLAYKLEGKIIARSVAFGRKSVLDELEAARSQADIRKITEGRGLAERISLPPAQGAAS